MENVRKNISVLITISLIFAFVPVSFDIGGSENYLSSRGAVNIKINSAFAENPSNASSYVESAAEKAGLLPGDFVSTVALILSAASGYPLSSDPGLKLGQDLSNSLENLIEAADYPDWDTLSDSEKSSWGNRDNYDAAKFNSLLTAFGLGSSVDGWYESGGGNFEWSEDANDKLEQIGSIGQNWISGAGNTIQSITGVLDQSQLESTVNSYLGNTGVTFATVNKSDYTDWPSSLPDTLTVARGSLLSLSYATNGLDRVTYSNASTDIYWIGAYTGSGGVQSGYNFVAFSDTGYMFISQQMVSPDTQIGTPNVQAPSQTYQGHTYYRHFCSAGVASTSISCNMPVNGLMTSAQTNALADVAPMILFGENQPEYSGSGVEEIQGYPEDITQEPDTVVYFPLLGFNPNTTWDDLTTENSSDQPEIDLDEIVALLQQFKFYTTGQLKVHDEGVYEGLGDIGTILTEIRNLLALNNDSVDAPDIIGDFDFPEFDQKATDLVDTISSLAPFGALLLISEMTAILASTGHIDEPELEFSFDFFPDHSYTVTINLSWLDDARPVINVVCILLLVYSLAGATIRLIELEAAS